MLKISWLILITVSLSGIIIAGMGYKGEVQANCEGGSIEQTRYYLNTCVCDADADNPTYLDCGDANGNCVGVNCDN